jgi:hypothetical protein
MILRQFINRTSGGFPLGQGYARDKEIGNTYKTKNPARGGIFVIDIGVNNLFYFLNYCFESFRIVHS